MGSISDEKPIFTSLIRDLMNAPHRFQRRQRVSPCKGLIKKGSISDVVLSALREHQGFLALHEIVLIVQKKGKLVSWSLSHLVSLGFVEASSDAARNSRYKKYRAMRVEEKK